MPLPVLPVQRAGTGEGCSSFAKATADAPPSFAKATEGYLVFLRARYGDKLVPVRILRRAARKGKAGNFPGFSDKGLFSLSGPSPDGCIFTGASDAPACSLEPRSGDWQ